MKFRYYLTGSGWANVDVEINDLKFNYRDSLVMGRGLDDLLKKILLVLDSKNICQVHDLFGGKEDALNWVIDEEGTSVEFDLEIHETWNITRLKIIQHYEEDKCVFDGEISFREFLFEIIKSCDEIINKYGMVGYFINSLSNCDFPITCYLLLKNYLQNKNIKFEAFTERFTDDTESTVMYKTNINEEINMITGN